jgi:hypothetical protein
MHKIVMGKEVLLCPMIEFFGFAFHFDFEASWL